MTNNRMIAAELKKLFEWYSSKDCWSSGIFIPEPIFDQHEDLVYEIKNKVSSTIPLQSIIFDLWDQDIHFEEELGSNWYFDAAFGSNACLDWCVTELASFVIDNQSRYGIPLIDMDDPDFNGEEFIAEESRSFVVDWRGNLRKKYA